MVAVVVVVDGGSVGCECVAGESSWFSGGSLKSFRDCCSGSSGGVKDGWVCGGVEDG